MNGRFRHHHIAASVGAVFFGLTVATSVAAADITWTSAKTLRTNDTGASIAAAAFDTQVAGVAWHEYSAGHRVDVGVRISHDGGVTFAPTVIFDRSRNPSVEICDGLTNVALAHKDGAGDWSIRHAVDDGAGGFDIETLADGAGVRGRPDIACGAGRVFISWIEEESDGFRLLMSTALVADREFGAPMTIGFDSSESFSNGLTVTASQRTAYVAFGDEDGKLRVRRWSIGAGPEYSLTGRGTQIVGPGNERDPSYLPVIAAEGDTVAMSWGRCAGTYARVSTDGGATWGLVRRIVHFPCDAIVEGGTGPDALAIDGERIALTYTSVGIPNFHEAFLVRTQNGFATFRRDDLGSHQGHVVGFLSLSGEAKLADAFDKHFETIKFRRQP